jgi:hypothetical protein
VGGQRRALIVANDKYEQDGLRNLQAPAADAEGLRRVLGDPQIGAFAVQVVRNEPSHVLHAQVEELFLESKPDDVLLLHFSCHGLKNESGELFFAAANTRPDRLGSTAVSADFVQKSMRATRSRCVVLLLDCCYGGAFAQGVTVRGSGDVNVLGSFPQERLGGGRGRAIITASGAMEFALEGTRLAEDSRRRRPSVFTAALIDGLASGDADRDQDGWVSLKELYDYVFDKVKEQNPNQSPNCQMDLQGELYLARSQKHRIKISSIPLDLGAALDNPDMYARLGVISELRSRLIGDNPPAAADAHKALIEIAGSGIKFLADPALAALREAETRHGPDQEIASLTQRLAEAQGLNTAAHARLAALQAELQRLKSQASLSTTTQEHRELQNAIDTTERLLGDTIADSAAAPDRPRAKIKENPFANIFPSPALKEYAPKRASRVNASKTDQDRRARIAAAREVERRRERREQRQRLLIACGVILAVAVLIIVLTINL